MYCFVRHNWIRKVVLTICMFLERSGLPRGTLRIVSAANSARCTVKLLIFIKLIHCLYVRKTVLWYPNKVCYLLRMSWNFFLSFSHLNNQMIINLCLIQRFCHSVNVFFNVSSFWCLNIFQSASNWIQIFLNAIPRDVFFF